MRKNQGKTNLQLSERSDPLILRVYRVPKAPSMRVLIIVEKSTIPHFKEHTCSFQNWHFMIFLCETSPEKNWKILGKKLSNYTVHPFFCQNRFQTTVVYWSQV